MKKKILTILAIIITVILLAFALLFIIDTIRMSNNQEVIFSTWGRDYKVSKSGENITENQTTTGKAEDDENSNINFALTMDDNIKDNTTWCGTFQLIWNENIKASQLESFRATRQIPANESTILAL